MARMTGHDEVVADQTLRETIDLIEEIVTQISRRSAMYGVVLDLSVGIASRSFLSALFKVGLFAQNLDGALRVSAQGERGQQPFMTPAVLMGLGFHYAVEAAPSRPGEGPDDPIDIIALQSLVERIEKRHGLIPVDQALINGLATNAELRWQASAPEDATS